MKLFKLFFYGLCLTTFVLNGAKCKKQKNIVKVEEEPESNAYFYVESTSSVPGYENNPCHNDCVFKFAIEKRDLLGLENCYAECKLSLD